MSHHEARFPGDQDPMLVLNFPVSKIPTSNVLEITPWLSSFIKVSPSTAMEMLIESTPTPKFEWLSKMRKHILSHMVESMVFHSQGCYIRCHNSTANSNVYWSKPLTTEESSRIAVQIVDPFLATLNEVSEFLTLAYGKCLDGPGFGASFLPSVSRKTESFAELFGERNCASIGIEPSWIDAHVLYFADNGDLLAINNTGELAWHVLAEHKTQVIASDINAFIKTIMKWPTDAANRFQFDSYDF